MNLVCTARPVSPRTQEWFARSRINYADYYLRLYIAFNAWYQSVAHTSNDRQALKYLKCETRLWQDYQNGRAMRGLRSIMPLLVELTQREPVFQASSHWAGYVAHVYDWPSLVEYWYQTRCYLVHGSEVQQPYVQLAYQTLSEFMSEILYRHSQRCGNDV